MENSGDEEGGVSWGPSEKIPGWVLASKAWTPMTEPSVLNSFTGHLDEA